MVLQDVVHSIRIPQNVADIRMGSKWLPPIPSTIALLPLIALCACGGGGPSIGGTGGGGGGGGAGAPNVISISAVAPSSYMTDMLSPLITVRGQNFNGGSIVLLDGVPALISSYESPTVVVAEFPTYIPAGVHQITVSGTNTSNALPLTIYTPPQGPQVMQAVPGFLVGFQTPMSATSADLNKDGRSDVIIAGAGGGSGQINVLYGQADGTLSEAQHIQLNAPVNTVLAGDLDGDGNQDLVAVQVGAIGVTVTVLLGDGTGNFVGVSSPQIFSGYASGPGSLVDMDGDGKPDLVLGYQTFSEDDIVWLKNMGGGSFGPPTTLALSTANDFGFVVSDFDGDGKPDIVYASLGPPQTLRYLKNLGNGQFADQSLASLNGTFGKPIAIDFNLDGILDLMVEGNGFMYSFAGNGDGSFTLAATLANPLFGGFTKLQLVAGDFDHDGFPDLAGQSGDIEPASMLYFFGDGRGNFTPQIVVGPGGYYSAEGDFNGDGLPDVVIADGSSFVSLALGRTDRNFVSPVALTPPPIQTRRSAMFSAADSRTS